MSYKKLKPHRIHSSKVEEVMRDKWREVYCDPNNPITTFDGVRVTFREKMFDHAFYESADFKSKDKSILSLNRLEKMLWIKDVLEDTTSILKQGWVKQKKKHDPTRRVALVKGNYVVVIGINRRRTVARFITAYEIQEKENVKKILSGPDWK